MLLSWVSILQFVYMSFHNKKQCVSTISIILWPTNLILQQFQVAQINLHVLNPQKKCLYIFLWGVVRHVIENKKEPFSLSFSLSFSYSDSDIESMLSGCVPVLEVMGSNSKSLMAQWLRQHLRDMKCTVHDLKIWAWIPAGLNLGYVVLWLTQTWTKNS